jgi:dihydrofolate synthase/folylpolyglutamate synthase
LAIAMIMHQSHISIPREAIAKAMQTTLWPARMQLLLPGPLVDRLPIGSEVWLDGGHNPDAGNALAKALDKVASIDVICGMLKNKDAMGFLKPISSKTTSFQAVPILGHEHHAPEDLCSWMRTDVGISVTRSSPSVADCIDHLATDGQSRKVLICGSLYLAGEVLKANGQIPN